MKKGTVKKLIASVLAGALMFSITACGNKNNGGQDGNPSSSQSSSEGILEKIKKSGKIVLGTSADFPPYEFHKEINGKDEIIGFDISIAKEIAKDLGVELEIKDMKFDGLLTALEASKVDFVMAGMNPDAERSKSVDFSKIYYEAEQTILVRAEDKEKYNGVESLTGKKIGAQKTSVQEKIANEQIRDAQVKSLGKVTDLVMELKNKKVEAVVVETVVAKSYAAANKDLAVADFKFDAGKDEIGSAVAVKKGSKDLVEAVNKTLDRLISEKTIEKMVIEANNQVDNQ
ncbi:transporter substrate-binding domain-containing protein [Clostridium polynesiense]|uniref:transporter substrate-binding domain-containing protein n=1 Tax=Clostridium polynesiense TaxID=1325933 RepID=UPI00058B6FFC|nr:transporter substrate-binding domain-containing protein [Clostridium polynesiense]